MLSNINNVNFFSKRTYYELLQDFINDDVHLEGQQGGGSEKVLAYAEIESLLI